MLFNSLRFTCDNNKDIFTFPILMFDIIYLLVSTRAVIGQISGPYSPAVGSVAKLFCDLSPSVLNF